MTFWGAALLALGLVFAADTFADGLRAIADAIKTFAQEKRIP